MRATQRTVRQSISLPVNLAAQVRRMAKTRKLSANRMLTELIENGIEIEKRKQQDFFELAERFRKENDPEKQSVSAINWAEWFSAADAADRAMEKVFAVALTEERLPPEFALDQRSFSSYWFTRRWVRVLAA